MEVDNPAVQLELTADGLVAQLRGEWHAVPTSLVEKSALLANMCKEADDEERVSIPVVESAIEAWLKYNMQEDDNAVGELEDLLTVEKARPTQPQVILSREGKLGL